MKGQQTTLANMGRVCFIDPEHGASLILDSKREWCPHRDHDGTGEGKDKTPSMLDRQEAFLDASDDAARPESA